VRSFILTNRAQYVVIKSEHSSFVHDVHILCSEHFVLLLNGATKLALI